MKNTITPCPNNENGLHRYFFNKMITEFQIIPNETMLETGAPIYEKLEYALSACACGRALKERIHYEA